MILLLIYGKSIGQRIVDAPIKASKLKHEIGFSVGTTLGYGPSYKIWINRLGTQITFAPLVNSRVKGFTSGFGFYYLVHKFKYSRKLFLYQSNRVRFFNNYTSQKFMFLGAGVIDKDIHNELFISSGIGIGYGFSRKKQSRNPWTFNMMAGYGVYESFTFGGITLDFSFMYQFSRNVRPVSRLN